MSTAKAATELPVDTAFDVPVLQSLFRISKSLRGLSGIHLAAIGLHPGQDEMLLAISSDRPLAVNVIAEILGVRPSTVSKMIDRLAEKGLVARQRDPIDSRKTAVSITPLGVELKSKVVALHERLENEFISAFSDNNIAAISASLAQMEDLLRHRLSRLR